MRISQALSAMILFASLRAFAGDEAGWNKAAEESGVTVYSREKSGSNIKEMKAVGLIDAPPMKVWAAIRDYDNYKTAMPYTEESRVLKKDPDGKVIYFYSVVNAPLVSRRDYLIRITDDSKWDDGKGFLKTSWTVPAASDMAAPSSGHVHVTVNDGYWLLEPKDNGTKTLATYYVFTDPGGSIPKFIANKANGTAVPNVFKSIRKTTSGK